MAEPRSSSHFPPEYLQKVKQVHSKGGYESQGYGYDWKIEEAEKNILRTHTTAVSARVLYRLASEVSVTLSQDFPHAYIFMFVAFDHFVSRDLKPRPLTFCGRLSADGRLGVCRFLRLCVRLENE